MLHVPVNTRYIPSPTISPTVEQKDFIPRDDSGPIVVESNEQVVCESPATLSPPIGSPNLHTNIFTQSMDPSQVSFNKLSFRRGNLIRIFNFRIIPCL